MAANHKMDLTKGSIPVQIIKFMVPVALTLLLQTVFHAADVAIVGRFSENAEAAVAAVGASGPITNLLLTIFMGMGAGVNVVIAQFMGARDSQGASRAVHTSIALALVCGVILIIIGAIFGRTMLGVIYVPENIMDDALLYFLVTLIGMPGILVYNFGCAILRSVGDTRQALKLLTISGIVNVLLNMLFVIVFKIDVLGVALATMISKFLAMFLILRALQQMHGACRFYPGKLRRIDFSILRKLLYNGIPAGIQSACFSFANILVAGTINSFGASALAASTVISFAEGGLTNAVSASLHQTMISFAGQNYGAKKYSRIWTSLKYCVIYALVIGSIMGISSYAFLHVWVPWFINEPTAEVMEFARIRALYLLLPCAISILQGISTGTLRGLGYSLYPTFVTLFGVCIFRVVWILWVFPKYKSFDCVILNFPITYILIILFCSFGIFYAYRKLQKTSRNLSDRYA